MAFSLADVRRWVAPRPRCLPISGDSDSNASRLDIREQSKLWNLVPFPIASKLGRTDRKLPKPGSTTYVNGLRGIACLVVYNQHMLATMQESFFIFRAYGMDENNTSFWQLPIIRVMFSGGYMVALFFVLSGFVLAYSPLRKMNSPKMDGESFLTSLSSSVFRRPFRLYIPMMTAVFFTALVSWFYPAFEGGNWRENDPSFFKHMRDFISYSTPAMNPMQWTFYHPRGFGHGWTLSMEYRGSLVVFLVALLTCRLTPAFRKIAIAFISVYAMAQDRWEIFCFLQGMFIAELRLAPINFSFLRRGTGDKSSISLSPLPQSETEKPILEHRSSSYRSPLAHAGWVCLLVLGLVLGGWPQWGGDTTLPYRPFFNMTPTPWVSHGENWPDKTKFFWVSPAAGISLLALEHLPKQRSFLDTKPLTYLGEISYSLYLVHNPLIGSFGHWFGEHFRESFGTTADTAWWAKHFATTIVLFWVSDVFWRLVDEPSVKWNRRFAEWCGIKEEKRPAQLPPREA